MTGPYIECFSVTKQYRSRRQLVTAVDSVDLKIDREEIVILKGRSGAGKSTLLNLIGGLISPTSGKIVIDGNIITELPNHAMSRLLINDIGIIFQGFNLIQTYTIFENIEVSLLPKGLTRNEIERIAFPLLDQFGLTEKIHLLPSELSAGQQQKAAIARTLARRPSIILADEPTGSVDNETASEIHEYFRFLKEKGKVTIVIATHGVVPESLADRIIIMNEGKVLKETQSVQ